MRMPSTTQRRVFGAAVLVITLVLLALLMAQRYISPAAMHRSDATHDTSHALPAELSVHAFCNATGGCEPCGVGSAELYADHQKEGCAETGYRQGLNCTYHSAQAYEVKLQRQIVQRKSEPEGAEIDELDTAVGQQFPAYHACSPTESGELQLAHFEWLMVVILALSLPIVYIRKRGSLDSLRSLLPV